MEDDGRDQPIGKQCHDEINTMTLDSLVHLIRSRKSCLIVGLDTDEARLPGHLRKMHDGVLYFNQQIIDATADLCVGYKINTAFYESWGIPGWECLEKTLRHIPEGMLRIADAKRGDIGNSSRHYARAFFETFGFDAVTVSPYMGADSIEPFLEYPGKWAILLGLTSNPGSRDFQLKETSSGPLFEEVIRKAAGWGEPDQLMFVAGATHPVQVGKIRELAPGHFLLIPGIGAQGGDIAEISRFGRNRNGGLLFNVSRNILYAGDGRDFAVKAREAAEGFFNQMGPALPE